jgi:hypothetical protein
MTSFVELNSGGHRYLINIRHIRGVTAAKDEAQRSVVDVAGKLMLVDHPYDNVVQLMLKSDGVAIGR